MLAAIMRLITLFRSKYCVYIRSSLIAILPKSHYDRIKRVHVYDIRQCLGLACLSLKYVDTSAKEVSFVS